MPLEHSRARSQPLPKFLKDIGSKRLTNGAVGRTALNTLYLVKII